MFAGVNGANDYQGDPPAVKVSPRFGATWALDAQHGRPRRLRSVLRALAVHAAEPRHDRLHAYDDDGAVGGRERGAAGDARNPFPAGLIAPTGSSLGILTGVGGNIDFIDQTKARPRCTSTPSTCSASCPATGGVARLHRVDRCRHRLRRIHQHRHRDQPDRSRDAAEGCERAMGCGGTASVGAQSVFRRAGHGRARHRRRRSSPASCCGRSRSSAT